ncbi:fibronectin type III-like domain-contianing protein [Nonomuraea glycinis]|uniref:fibronectin type III-like domain-contianing protein n=1 Tax=Nonomuraea glycinis TaxID=2047744 RepID=UPI003F4C1ACF
MLQYDQIAAKMTYRYSTAPCTYPLGHGLTYSAFRYEDLTLPDRIDAAEDCCLELQLTNTAAVTSEEVVQVYLHSRDSAYGEDVPRTQLVAFQRVKNIIAGETRTITLTVRPADMFIWDVSAQSPVVGTGVYDISVGASSADTRVATTIHIDGGEVGSLDFAVPRNAWEYYTTSRGVSHWEVSNRELLRGTEGATRSSPDATATTSDSARWIWTACRGRTENCCGRGGSRLPDGGEPLIEVRGDTPDGPLLGTVHVAPTGDVQEHRAVRGRLRPSPGLPDLFRLFRGHGLYLDSIQLLSDPV